MLHYLYLALFCLLLPCRAETLRWAADAESGVPNVFYDPEQPKQLTGFEYEIALHIAQQMQRPLEFYPNDWEMLVPGLQRNHYDILLNAIDQNSWESVAEKAKIQLSIPYYITKIQLVVNQQSTIQSLQDCDHKHIGILKQSKHAEKTLQTLPNVHTVIYDDEVKAYADLRNQRLDAVLLDYPESLYYAKVHQDVRLVQQSIPQTIAYVVMVRSEDTKLLQKINQAIEALKANGQLRLILERWGLWNAETAQYFKMSVLPASRPLALEKYVDSVNKTRQQSGHFYLTCLPLLGNAAWMTLKLSVTAMFFAMIMGFSLAVLKTYGTKPIRFFVSIYIACIRGTPLLIQLLLIFYGLPNLAKHLPEPFCHWICFSPFLAGVIALAINYSAYECEIYRAGLNSVPRGQMEAARALGMSQRQALWYVIFPQAIRTVIPPVTNDFSMLLQDSSLVSMITIVELTRAYQNLAATSFNYLGTGLLVAAVYLALGYPFFHLSHYLEKRLHYTCLHQK